MPERIAAVRCYLNLSQGTFAQRLGVSRNVIGRYEAGVIVPHAVSLRRIATVGGGGADWLPDGGAGQADEDSTLR